MEVSAKIIATILFIILAIVGVILILVVFGGFSEVIKDSARQASEANNCSESKGADGEPYVYNFTDKYCYNGTNTDGSAKLYVAKSYALPLSGLFTPSGLLVTILLLCIFILAIGVVVYTWKKGR